jgi:iron complex transport system ATP-binding protein
MTHREPVLTIEQLGFSYSDKPIFTDLNAVISAGDFIGVAGPNGSGKSTLLKLLNGLLKPAAGRILLQDMNLAHLNRMLIAQKTAFVPQQTVFANAFTVMDIVLMGRFPHKRFLGFENHEDIELARSMLALTGSAALENRLFDTLSGGEKQRVILASALAQEPDILILDEPLTGLDIFYQLHILSILKTFNTKRNLTIVAALHDVNLAGAFCNRIWLLNGPEVFVDGAPEQVLTPGILESVFRISMEPVETRRSIRWLVPDLDREPL